MASPLVVTKIRPQKARAARAVRSTARPAATAAVLFAGDALALAAAGWVGYFLWSRVNTGIGPQFAVQLLPALAVSLVVFACWGLYPGAGLSPVEELRRLVLGTTTVWLASTAAIFLSKEGTSYSRGVVVAAWLSSAALTPAVRALIRKSLARYGWWGVPVLVLGAGEAGRLLAANLKAHPECGLRPVAYLDDSSEKAGAYNGVPVAGPIDAAPELARRLGVRQAILAMPGVGGRRCQEVLERVGTTFSRLVVVPDMFGLATLWVSPKDLSGVLGLEVRQNLLMPANRWLKRAIDVAMTLVLAAPALLIVATAAAWIKRASRGPAFYFQEREGQDGRRIRVAKLRTMRLDADELLERHLAGNAEARREWRERFKLREDPRVVPGIGRLLRKTSLDELPQLWSVLKGDMSLVGPRPFPYYHLDGFEPAFRALRGRVRPGLTGLWQVSGRSDGGLAVQQAMDTYYIRNWSLWLDLHILARTVYVVLAGRGAY